MKIGIIKEGKIPSDNRVPLAPNQCAHINETTSHKVVVQSSDIRCFSDQDYVDEGITIVENVDDCDLLMGVKEVPIDSLLADKMYMFFSHTIKRQPYNRKLLKAILEKNIHLVDYETIVDENDKRLIAFGKFAGMVGAHNGVMTFGARTGLYALPRMTTFLNYKKAKENYEGLKLPNICVVLTGSGRVGNGAARVLQDLGFKKVSPEEFKHNDFNSPIFTQLHSGDYIQKKDESDFEKHEYYKNPSNFKIDFSSFYKKADIFVNGIYWDSDGPAFFTIDEMQSSDFNIQVIADVTCDIAPESSIPSTVRPSTIEEPVYGFNPSTGNENDPYQPDCIDVMAIDNLPNELPRDASRAFGDMFIEHVLPELDPDSDLIQRSSMTTPDGKLTEKFKYLESYSENN